MQVTGHPLIHSRITQLPRHHKFPFGLFAGLTALPAVLVGGAIWFWADTLPGCETVIAERLTAPDQSFDLVVFSLRCGEASGANTQAALLPVGEPLPPDAASFVSVGAEANFEPRWSDAGTIELTLPAGAKIYRQDADVAGVRVSYR